MPTGYPDYSPSLYQPGGTSIAELIARGGDIAARGAERSGAIWGNAISQLGQIGGEAVRGIQEEKAKKTRAEAFRERVMNWDGKDIRSLAADMADLFGPEVGMQITKSVEDILGAHKTGETLTPEAAIKGAISFGNLAKKLGPEGMAESWDWVEPFVRPLLDVWQIPEEERSTYNPLWSQKAIEIEEAFKTAQLEAPIETVDAQGNPVKRRPTTEELAQGVPIYREPSPPQIRDVGGTVEGIDPATGTSVWSKKKTLSPQQPSELDPATISNYVDDLDKGQKILSDIPPAHRDAVNNAAKAAGVIVPTRRPSEKTLAELGDAETLFEQTEELLTLPTGIQEWAKAQLVPDWVIQLTGWSDAARAKANKSDFFLYMAVTLKALQGGKPSDTDMKFFMANLPRQGEAAQSKNDKIRRIMKRLKTRYNGRIKRLRQNLFALRGYGEIETDDEASSTEVSAPLPVLTPGAEAALKRLEANY